MIEATAKSVLIVDRVPRACLMVADELSRWGFDCHSVSESAEARELIEAESYDVLIADAAMPGVSGLDLLAHARRHAPRCKVVLMVGPSSRKDLAQALVLGAYDYVGKPVKPSEIAEIVRRATSGAAESPHLPIREAAAAEVGGEAKRAALETVTALARAVEAKDPFMRRHSEHVMHYATCLAETLGARPDVVQSVRVTALLHDIGKIGVPDHVLAKPGRLNEDDMEHIRRHPVLGADILSNVALFGLEAMMVRHHHENWDGSGYPDGLTGEEIPWVSRIVRIADSMDAMLMGRMYKEAYDVDVLLGELRCGSGRLYDPQIAAVALLWCTESPDKLILPGRAVEAMA